MENNHWLYSNNSCRVSQRKDMWTVLIMVSVSWPTTTVDDAGGPASHVWSLSPFRRIVKPVHNCCLWPTKQLHVDKSKSVPESFGLFAETNTYLVSLHRLRSITCKSFRVWYSIYAIIDVVTMCHTTSAQIFTGKHRETELLFFFILRIAFLTDFDGMGGGVRLFCQNDFLIHYINYLYILVILNKIFKFNLMNYFYNMETNIFYLLFIIIILDQ